MSANYANPGISNASNPSNFGYHHGPIPNPNHGWVPSDVQELHDAGRAYTVTTEMNAAAPNQGNRLSSINTGVCDIIVNPDTNTMCGTVIASQPALRRHIRSAHPGALINPTRTNTSISEESVGKQAIQNWVRSGGWRNADYVREPVAGPAGGLIETYADAMEELAQNDANFAATYGTHFHRPAPRRGVKRQRGVVVGKVLQDSSASALNKQGTLSAYAENVSRKCPAPPTSQQIRAASEPTPTEQQQGTWAAYAGHLPRTWRMLTGKQRGGSAPPSSRKRKNRHPGREESPETPTKQRSAAPKKKPTPRKKASAIPTTRKTRSQNQQEEITFKEDIEVNGV